MGAKETIPFGEFRLDLAAGRLMSPGGEIRLRRKVWELLVHLACRPGVVVSKDELLDAIWPGTVVGPNTLSNAVWELRKALGGKLAGAFVETVPGRGFRFRPERTGGSPESIAPVPGAPATLRAFVGRRQELALVESMAARAATGERQFALVGGDAGIGKTTVVDMASAHLAAHGDWLVVRGQCLQLPDGGEPYLPILEAFDKLARALGGEAVAAVARRHAPTWLVQLPWLAPAAEITSLRRSLVASGTHRMIHDGAKLIEQLAQETPIFLILEDLHWADPGTIDLLVALAERSLPARLLVVASYRPVESALDDHPIAAVARFLEDRGRCRKIHLEPWSPIDVERYCRLRFGDAEPIADLASRIEKHSGGIPLFVVSTADHLVESGAIQQREGSWQIPAEASAVVLGLPESAREIVDRRLAAVPAAVRSALEVAALIGIDFAAETVAAALGDTADTADLLLDEAMRTTHLIEAAGVDAWPDGTVLRLYRFTHGLYQQGVASRVSPALARTMHLAIAECLERAFVSAPGLVANRLALHFGAAGRRDKRIDYLELGALGAVERFDCREGALRLDRVIEEIRASPPSDARSQREAARWIDLGNILAIDHSPCDLRIAHAYDEALAVLAATPDDTLTVRASLGKYLTLTYRLGATASGQALTELLERIEVRQPRLAPVLRLYRSLAWITLGRLAEAEADLDAASVGEREPGIPALLGFDVMLHATRASVAALRGEVALVAASHVAALGSAEDDGLPFQALVAFVHGAAQHTWLHEWDQAEAFAARASALAQPFRIEYLEVLAELVAAGARMRREPDAEIDRFESLLCRRARLNEHSWDSLFLGWLAEAYLSVGDGRHARERIEAALAVDELSFRSECWRIKGHVLVATTAGEEAGACFARAVEIAEEQGARAFALRAATDWAAFLRAKRKRTKAVDVLERVIAAGPRPRGLADARRARAELRALTD